jgi:antagonist of KipI
VLSAGVCAGCVQLSSDGLPIILLAEHQTTGGYAVPLTVISADTPDAAQLRPGDQVRFRLVVQSEAAVALAEKMKTLAHSLHEPGP